VSLLESAVVFAGEGMRALGVRGRGAVVGMSTGMARGYERGSCHATGKRVREGGQGEPK